MPDARLRRPIAFLASCKSSSSPGPVDELSEVLDFLRRLSDELADEA
jgi:hypothetical protein